MIDKFTKDHLEKFIQNHITEDHHEAFRNYALSRLEEDMEHWMNVGWSTLYGQFLLKN